MNNIIRFLSDKNSTNWFQVTLYFEECENCYYNLIVSDDKDVIYYTSMVKNGNWYNYDFNKIFNYNVKLLQFNGDVINKIYEKSFNIEDYTDFNVILKSKDDRDIKTWKYYLWLVQIKMNIKLNIIVNEDFINQDFGDYVEISRESYDKFLKKSEKPLTDDYSSLTIIKTLFDIIDDNIVSEILNHTWLKENIII